MSQPDPTVDAIVDALLSIPDTAKRHEAFLELTDLLDPPTPREELRRWAFREHLRSLDVRSLGAAWLSLTRDGDAAAVLDVFSPACPRRTAPAIPQKDLFEDDKPDQRNHRRRGVR